MIQDLYPDQAILDRLSDLIRRAQAKGADAADAVFVESRSLSLAWRLGRQERLERSEAMDVGLRVFAGQRQAVVSTSDLAPAALDELAGRAVAMAREVPEDPWCGLADSELLARDVPDLESCDPAEPSVEALKVKVAAAEDAARAVPGITNSEGAEAGWSWTRSAIVGSNGFAAARARSQQGLSVSVLAGDGTGMERDYDYTAAVFGGDLRAPEEVGRCAGERAVRRLNPRKSRSATLPVVYEPRAARSLVGHLAAAINGTAVARGTTFLADRMGKALFPEAITIVDDPLRRRGLRSRPFDGEGLPTRRIDVIERGVLQTWILDLRSARQLGLASTGHASRGTSAPPSPGPSNLYVAAGAVSPEALMADIVEGLYVTELIGFGINGVTGDYSRGASGFWIENGALAYPVSEVTVAGNLLDMFAHMTAADDLVFRYGTDAPTLRIDGMTVAGQ
ncbi:MAG: TldD/PmbA family protein [Rhodospirillales bacterium]|nr:MAG: TldD/PmbA family protein [Rhodospirillales bacterium]